MTCCFPVDIFFFGIKVVKIKSGIILTITTFLTLATFVLDSLYFHFLNMFNLFLVMTVLAAISFLVETLGVTFTTSFTKRRLFLTPIELCNFCFQTIALQPIPYGSWRFVCFICNLSN